MQVRTALVFLALAASAAAQQGGSAPVALTIYNQDFAVARTTVDLDLKAGVNQVTTTNVTSQLEPDSVVLRDPSGKIAFKVDEQNYDAGVIDQNAMFEKFEGKTIQFDNGRAGPDGKRMPVDGKIIRGGQQPIVEVNGVIQFSYPGLALLPDNTEGLLLKPTLRWEIESAKPARVAAELAYITHGMSWQATYNVVAPESKDVTGTEPVSITGWVTIQNNSGTDFPQARVKLMAGDVAKIRDYTARNRMANVYALSEGAAMNVNTGVTQQAFDDFHLYDLNRTVSLANHEIKQVQFIEVAQVSMSRVYEYDGANYSQFNLNTLYSGYRNDQQNFGLGGNTKVNIRAEVKNSVANHLGMPLPAGRIRMYRRDADGQMEFIGEGTINHTPTDETVRVPVGSAFDVTGDRKQTDFHIDQRAHTTDETFEITVKNQKTTAVNVAVVEHMYRGLNWQLTQQSTKENKRDSHTVEFPVTIPPAGEVKVTYTVRYTW